MIKHNAYIWRSINMSGFPALYVPPAFAAPAGALRGWIARRPFAQLVTFSAQGLQATATPLVFASDAADEAFLLGHIAGRNPQAKVLDGPALALFRGPDAYVSPRWYPGGADLPTWNYVAVQVHGVLEPLDGESGRRQVLARTISVMERDRPTPWSLDEAQPERVTALLPHIRAFRLRIDRIEGVEKLSQNRPEPARLALMAALQGTGDTGAAEVAALMAERRPHSG